MSNDTAELVERLRDAEDAARNHVSEVVVDLLAEAADRLEALSAPVVDVTALPEWLCQAPEGVEPCTPDDPHEWRGPQRCYGIRAVRPSDGA